MVEGGYPLLWCAACRRKRIRSYSFVTPFSCLLHSWGREWMDKQYLEARVSQKHDWPLILGKYILYYWCTWLTSCTYIATCPQKGKCTTLFVRVCLPPFSTPHLLWYNHKREEAGYTANPNSNTCTGKLATKTRNIKMWCHVLSFETEHCEQVFGTRRCYWLVCVRLYLLFCCRHHMFKARCTVQVSLCDLWYSRSRWSTS